jgi:hypothetical protein
MLMLTLLECGIAITLNDATALCPVQVTSSHNVDALSTGLASFKVKLLSVPLKANTLPYLWQLKNSFPHVILCNNFVTTFSLTHPFNETLSKTMTNTLAATQIFKDNASCIVLAYSDGHKQCTKHISLKWHHFSDPLKWFHCHHQSFHQSQLG